MAGRIRIRNPNLGARSKPENGAGKRAGHGMKSGRAIRKETGRLESSRDQPGMGRGHVRNESGYPGNSRRLGEKGNGERNANTDREPGEGSAGRGCDGRETKRGWARRREGVGARRGEGLEADWTGAGDAGRGSVPAAGVD